jgi:phosphoglucan,water dikinase
VVNVDPAMISQAIQEVWASLWTRRGTLSRVQVGIPHDRIRMAVLIQELVKPDMSFIMHTVNPQTGNRDEALVELAVGLGEILASVAFPGTPYRMACDRQAGTGRLTACATFSAALRPGRDGKGVVEERLEYVQVPLSADPAFAPKLGERLAKLAVFLEAKLGRPQDVEGVWAGEVLHVIQARPQMGL